MLFSLHYPFILFTARCLRWRVGGLGPRIWFLVEHIGGAAAVWVIARVGFIDLLNRFARIHPINKVFRAIVYGGFCHNLDKIGFYRVFCVFFVGG
jgi:hypothetical protein